MPQEEKLDLPFKQLLWTLWKLRLAQKEYKQYLNYDNRRSVKYWEEKADILLETLGVDGNTDFKNIEITFTND